MDTAFWTSDYGPEACIAAGMQLQDVFLETAAEFIVQIPRDTALHVVGDLPEGFEPFVAGLKVEVIRHELHDDEWETGAPRRVVRGRCSEAPQTRDLQSMLDRFAEQLSR